MGFFDSIFRKKIKPKDQPKVEKPTDLNPDERFVQGFIEKGGKFLYCETEQEVLGFLSNILEENAWESMSWLDQDLNRFTSTLGLENNEGAQVFFTGCEHLIVEDSSLLFSSNQLKEIKLTHYPENFIVLATTSQLLFTKDEGLTSIKYRFKKEIPTNISAIKDYMPHKKDPNFLNYGNMNSKNLYLLLLEDL